jgi:Trk-type K+ transport systems, membrane components
MDLYNAVAHAMTAVATAGFSPEPLSAAAFTAPAQWVLLAGMLIGGTSFVLLVLTARTGPRRLFASEEFRVYVGSVTALSLAVALTLVLEGRYAWADALHHAAFNTVSIVTTTGFASADFAQWSAAGTHLLFLGMFLGAMVGSTTCSIKTLRWVIVAKTVRRQLFLAVNPRAVRPVRLDGEPIDEEIIPDALVFVLLSIVLVLLLTVVVVIDTARAGVAVSEFEALGASAATFLNIGPGFGVAGPFGSYHGFPTPTKLAMIVLMWVGRIEIIPVLVLITRTFWR